jgi:hypothetical protein
VIIKVNKTGYENNYEVIANPSKLIAIIVLGGVQLDWINSEITEIWVSEYNGAYYLLTTVNKGVQTYNDIREVGFPVKYKVRAKKDIRYSNFSNESSPDLFYIGTGFNDVVSTLLVDSNNKLYVGGGFTSYKDVSQNRLIRLNPDGTKDTLFDIGNGFNGEVRKIKFDPYDSTKIYVGGNFTSYKDVSEAHLIKLNIDGTKDASFNIGIGFGNHTLGDDVKDFAFDSSGRIFCVGHFHSFQSPADIDTSIRYSIRLFSNGNRDLSFDPSGGIFLHDNMSYNETKSVYIDPCDNTNSIYIGGDFTWWRDNYSRGLAKLNQDGTYNTMFEVSMGWPYPSIQKIYKDKLGRLLIGGYYNYWDSSLQTYIDRKGLTAINASTSYTDWSFDVSRGVGGTPNDIIEDKYGQIYLVGTLNTFKGDGSIGYFIKLDPSGALDPTFPNSEMYYNLYFGAYPTYPRTVAVDLNNNVYIGGFFTVYKNASQNRLIRFDSYGNKN